MDKAADAAGRARMVEQLLKRGISDARILAAMAAVPRDLFVPPEIAAFAYEDTALQIAAGQTISQPYIVARMLELASLAPEDKVLEVGAGSGYAAAVMSLLARRVIALERHGELARAARDTLRAGRYFNVKVVEADGTNGCAAEAPFDAIIVSAGGEVPSALETQLAAGGRLVIPAGPRSRQRLQVHTREAQGRLKVTEHDEVTFVPLVRGMPLD